MKLTNKEAIANLNHIYGIVSPDIQRSLDVAFKALEERTQGEWIQYDNEKIKCPFCEVIYLIYAYPNAGINFCPNCGAKMKGGQE